LFTLYTRRVPEGYPQLIRLEKVVTSPNYDPPDRTADPSPEQYGTEQSDPRLAETVRQPGTFAESELEYAPLEGGGRGIAPPEGGGTTYLDEPIDSRGESNSTVDTAKSQAANVKDTAADAAVGVKDVAKSEASNVAEEAKYQARNLVDQTRSELRGQASNQQSALAEKLKGWASELGSMASKSDESGTMTDLAHEASRRVGEVSHWLDGHEPGDVLDEVKRFARRRPVAFLAIAAAAGIVAGRVTRGAVAANTSVDSDRESSPARAYDSDTYRADFDSGTPSGSGYGDRTYQDGGYAPRHSETSAPVEPNYEGLGNPVGGEFPQTGTTYPNVTPAVDQPDYPPPVGGDVRR
jgi:hypothetical protein